MQTGSSDPESQDTKISAYSKAGGPTIAPDISIRQLLQRFPSLEQVLVTEFGFHCVNCFLADIDTLEEGAAIHGIVGEDFQMLMKRIHEAISSPNQVQ